MSTPDWLEPTWPQGFVAGYLLFVAFVLGVTKVFRGRVMHHRAQRIDLFGWSIILFDLIFGGALLFGVLWEFYPGIHTATVELVVGTIVLGVALWQLAMVIRADRRRIQRAVSDRPQIYFGDPPIDAPPSQERRTEYRRLEDRKLRGLE